MTFDELVFTRRSIRKYKVQKVEKEKLEELINAAVWAPTAGNFQLLHYIIVEDDKIVGKIRMFSPGMSKSAPCVIVICADLVDAEEKGGAIIKDSVPLDAAFASQNILLKAHEIGLGTCVVKSYNESSVGTILKLPSYITPLLIITVGYYEELPKPPSRKDVSQVIHFNDWEGR